MAPGAEPEPRVFEPEPPSLLNLTPLELGFTVAFIPDEGGGQPEERAVSLKPFGTYRCPAQTLHVEVRDAAASFKLGEFKPSPEKKFLQSGQLKVTPDLLRLESKEPKPGVGQEITFSNRTGIYVDICTSPEGGQMRIPPGESRSYSSKRDLLWVATSTFTGEVLDMFISRLPATGEDKVGMDVTRRFQSIKSRAREVVLPPVLPSGLWYSGSEPVPKLEMVGYPPRLDAPDVGDYVAVGISLGGRRERFNCVADVTTRCIKISGVELRWDSSNQKLMSWAGADHIDLETLEMYADRVIIAAPLHFPQTDVTIWARELRFEGSGAIDTTPLGWRQRASWDQKLDPDEVTPNPNKEAEGGSDHTKNKNYVPKSGRPGESAGNIILNVRQLSVPAGSDNNRLVARGGKGQAGEFGFAPQVADLPTIPIQDVEGVIKSFPIQCNCWQWKWPKNESYQETVDWPGQITFQGKPLLSDQNNPKAPHSNVVHLKLYAVSYAFAAQDVNIFWFPGADVWKEGLNMPRVRTIQEVVAQTRPAPQRAHGAKARPGGTPGKGGTGGKIRTLVPSPDDVPLCDVRGGEPGDPTPQVDGGPPGGPAPARVVQMTIVLKAGESLRDMHPADRRMYPWLSVGELEATPGDPVAAIKGQQGDAGKIDSSGKAGPKNVWSDSNNFRHITASDLPAPQWMHPSAVDAVLSYAKDCMRTNHRELASRQLGPYYAELHQLPNLPPNLMCRKLPIEVMRSNLLANLDYYGNPPGWVPHLDATTTFSLNQATRKLALELLLFARAQIDAFDGKAAKAVDLEQIRAKLRDEIARRQDTLGKAYQEILNAQTSLDKAQKNAASIDARAADVHAALTKRITDDIQVQRIFSGVMKVVGGAMKVFPLGQPFLGLGADVVSAAGDFDWTNDNPGDQLSKMLGKVKAPVDKLVTETGKSLSDPDKPEKRALEDEITAAKRQADDAKSDVNKEESQLKREYEEKTAYLKDKIGVNDERIKQLVVELKKANIYLEELKEPDPEKEAQALAASLGYPETLAKTILVQMKIVREDSRKIEELIEQLKGADAKNKAAADQQAKSAYDEALKLLTAKKNDTEAYATNLKELERKRDDKATALARKSENVQVWVKRLEGLGAGINGIGEGAAKLWVNPGTDEAAAKAKIEQMMVPKPGERVNPLRDSYRALMKEVEKQAAECKVALATLQRNQQAAASELAAITQALTSLSDLSHVSAELSGALDIRVRRHLQDMAVRARDMMQKSLYHFIMAFRYEYLEDVPPDLYQIDALVDSFANLARFDKNGKVRKIDGEPMTIETLPPAEYAEFDTRVVKSEMLKIAGQIKDKLVSGGQRKANSITIEISNDVFGHAPPGVITHEGELLKTLSTERSVEVDIAKDLYVFPKYNCQGLRIKSIIMAADGIVLEKMPKAFNLKLTFSAPKQTVVYEKTSEHPDGAYYFFTKGERDYEMTWSYVYHRSSDGKSSITADTTVDESLLGAILSADVKLRDYLPGVYGPPMTISAAILGGQNFEFEIASLKFDIYYEATREPRPEERRILPAHR